VLTIYWSASHAPLRWQPGVALPAAAPLWLDLLDPSDAERAQAEALLGAQLPTRDQTSALELSSRMRAEASTLRLNLPAFVRADDGLGAMTPLALVLTQRQLASVRYGHSQAFDLVDHAMRDADAPDGSVDLFVALLETFVNVGADRLQEIAGQVSLQSRAIFSDSRDHSRQLRGALFKVGAMQRQVTQIRQAVLGTERIVTWLRDGAPDWLGADAHARLSTVRVDIGALTEFDQQLNDRIQFLLDAVLGFINNNQNDIMKVLTVITVVTIPPMILAGIWGMNFKSISEYNWQHGYAFGLTMIVLSMLLPLGWFRWKKWI
jgi:magnesium transporter